MRSKGIYATNNLFDVKPQIDNVLSLISKDTAAAVAGYQLGSKLLFQIADIFIEGINGEVQGFGNFFLAVIFRNSNQH